jgi:hypothetical protein
MSPNTSGMVQHTEVQKNDLRHNPHVSQSRNLTEH